MGIWIEIHCDVRKDGCFDNINDGSMGMAMSTKSSMMGVYAIVKKDAISRGWNYRASKWIFIALAVTWVIEQSPLGRDSTDELGWFTARSGMAPMTDMSTGCQYLRTGGGGIMPRLDAAGRQIGCR